MVNTLLISHKYKFIFIKTLKTGGTSIEVDLSRIMGEDDVVTPINPAIPGHVPRNYKTPLYPSMTASNKFYNHMPATEIKKIIGAEIFNSYFKFCIEREPVDKCVSHYSMLKNSPEHNDGNEHLTWGEYVDRAQFPLDHNKYLDANGALIVDQIIKYESLAEELSAIGKLLGFNCDIGLTRAKSGFREQIIVNQQQREMIYRCFEMSLRFTGYKRALPA